MTAAPGDARVALAWTIADGSGYRIYRAIAGVWDATPVATLSHSTTTFTNTGLTNGLTYTFKVAAYNSAGNGPASIEASATPIAPPGGLTAAAGDRQVALSWQASAGALTYNLYRSTSTTDSSFVQIATGVGALGIVDTGLTNGTTYYYRAAAVGPASTSALTSKASAKPLPPAPANAPGNLVAAASSSRVDLTWAAVDTATGYRIYRSTTGVFDSSVYATSSTPSYTNWSVANGTTYSYRVAATNMGGGGPQSSVVNATPLASPVVTAASGHAEATLTWPLVAGAASYTVFRSKSSDDASLLPVDSGKDLAGSPFTDTGLTNDTTYYYRVKAYAITGGVVTGMSTSSRVSARPVPWPPSSAPGNFVAKPGNARVDLSWDSVDAATGYRIYRSTTPGVFDGSALTSVTASPFTDWSAKNGTPYFYEVAGYNTGGNGPASTPLAAMPIAPPAGVTAAPGDTQVTVSWQTSAGAATYTLYRSTSTDDTTLVAIANDATALTYLDTGLTNGTTYYYRLRACAPTCTPGGTPSSISSYSSRVSARPVPPPPAAAPANLVAKPGNGRVDLTWDSVTGATAYRVLRLNPTTGAYEKITTVTTLTYRNYGLTNDTPYSFKVAGNNMGGDGPQSDAVTATPLAPPAAPTNPSATGGDCVITLSWTPQATATSYNVYRGTSAGKEATTARASVAGTAFVDVCNTSDPAGVENGPTYYYKVTAVNYGGESVRSAEVSATGEGPQAPIDAAATAAFRLLRQATWGPRPGDVDRVKAMGAEAFIAEQLAMPPSVYPDALFSNSVETSQEFFMRLALEGPDQLRQRVAWALHKIMVVSAVEVPNADAIVTYYRLMMNGAFGNFRDLMRAVTLNPAMGRYLNMLNNKNQALTGVPPNENYPRELMQLFTMGIPKLTAGGVAMIDATGAPIPAYTENDVKELARILTGWTFGDGDPATIPRRARSENYRVPMEAVVPTSGTAYHDGGSKTFLGAQFVAGQTAVQDLDQALDVIFNHPNVGPFISRQLIQQLVISNPSASYVAAVAAVFNDNGAGVRGDLGAVVKAILMHPDARTPSPLTSPSPTGKLAEPVSFVIAPLRALAAIVIDHPFMSDKAESMGQKVFYPPSVFSYFSPGYRVRGTVTPGSNPPLPIQGPEFQILTSVTILERANFIGELLGNWYSSSVTIDYARFYEKAKDAAALVDYCNLVFMGGRMTEQERREIINAVRVSSYTNVTERTRTAIYLTLAIAQSQVDR